MIIGCSLIGACIGHTIVCISTAIYSNYNKPCESCYETKYYSITTYADGTKKRWLVDTDTTCGSNIIIAPHDEHTEIRKISTNCPF